MARRPNLLLITIDSLRADHLGCLGYARRLSPHIDRLASEGTLFTQAIANGPRSPASFPSILASIYLSAGAEQGIPQETTTLAQVLKMNGYATAGLCAGNPHISRYCDYHKGFSLFHDFLTLEPGARIFKRENNDKLAPFKRIIRRILEHSDRYDPAFFLFSSALRGKKNISDVTKSEEMYPFEGGEKLNEQAIAWLSRLPDTPFFLWLHYMDVHFPYLPRVSRHRLLDYSRFALSLICLLFKQYSLPRQVMIDLYDDRIRAEDKIIGQFVDWLKAQQLVENTIIVITADHGEEFQEHGSWGHDAKLYDELLRVPLIMTGPGLAQNAVVETQIGLIDLAPTILDLLDIKEEVESFQGTSFLPRLCNDQSDLMNQYVFSEAVHLGGRCPPIWGQDNSGRKLYRIRSCRSEDWKYIWDEEDNKQELYDLHLDPKETKNLADSKPKKTQEFGSIMRDRFAELDLLESVATGATKGVLSPQEEEEIARRLHDLGYF